MKKIIFLCLATWPLIQIDCQLADLPVINCCECFITQTVVYAKPDIENIEKDSILEIGVCWGTSPEIDTSKNKVPAFAGNNPYFDNPTSIITGLEPGTFYHIRAYVVTNSGLLYSEPTELTTSRAPDLLTGLVAYYPMDENMNDTTGNNHHGTANGINRTTDRLGIPDKALAFDGSINSLQFKGYTIPDRDFFFSIACYVKITDENADTIFQNYLPQSLKFLLRVVNHRYQFELSFAGNKVVFSDYDGHFQIDTENPRFDLLSIGINRYKVFFIVNHRIVGFDNISPPLANLFPLILKNNLVYSFKGNADELRIFNRELYWEDLEAMYNNRLVTKPLITTDSVNSIGIDKARIFGTMKYFGGDFQNETGFCWSTSPDPDTSLRKVASFMRTITFSGILTELLPDTRYYVRSYSINSAEVAYGQTLSFVTLPLGSIIGSAGSGSAQSDSEGLLSSNSSTRNTENNLNYYPNPVQKYLFFPGRCEKNQVVLYDVNGRIISRQIIENGKISLELLKPGMYFMRIQGKQINETVKIIKQ